MSLTASRSQSVEWMTWFTAPNYCLKSKREINRSSYDIREKHLQKKWQRKKNLALKTWLNWWIFTSAAGGEQSAGESGRQQPQASLSKSLQVKRDLRVNQNTFVFSLNEKYIFSESYSLNTTIIFNWRASLLQLSVTPQVFLQSNWPISQWFNYLTCFSFTWWVFLVNL